MSFDRIQSKEGTLEVSALPTSGGYAGAVEFGGLSGFLAGSATDGGGAFYGRPMPTSSASQALSNGSTITHTNAPVVFVDVSGGLSVSGIILQAGTIDGQILVVCNVNGTLNATFAAAGTSNVANGTSASITALKANCFIWNSVAGRWFTIL